MTKTLSPLRVRSPYPRMICRGFKRARDGAFLIDETVKLKEADRVEIMVTDSKQSLPPVRVGCPDILLNRSLNSVAGASSPIKSWKTPLPSNAPPVLSPSPKQHFRARAASLVEVAQWRSAKCGSGFKNRQSAPHNGLKLLKFIFRRLTAKRGEPSAATIIGIYDFQKEQKPNKSSTERLQGATSSGLKFVQVADLAEGLKLITPTIPNHLKSSGFAGNATKQFTTDKNHNPQNLIACSVPVARFGRWSRGIN